MDATMRASVSVLPPKIYTSLYSKSRKKFLANLEKETTLDAINIPREEHVDAWGLTFRCGLFNSAGMFKNGDGYNLVDSQGAGAWICGTTTKLPRRGNIAQGIIHPFSPFPRSGAALNWMGLPNEGHEAVAKKISNINPKKICPIGASLSSDPAQHGYEALNGLLEGMELYQKAGINFLEVNESCPNVEHDTELDSSGLDKHLVERLHFIKDKFLNYRVNKLPVIIKFSNDTSPQLITKLIDMLYELDYDGINIGNTSTKYKEKLNYISEKERKHFNWFSENFGGGISGLPLKEDSLNLCKIASEHLKTKSNRHEFHIIRTGGIFDKEDLDASKEIGIKLNQWYTGYFEAFSQYGHKLYHKLFN